MTTPDRKTMRAGPAAVAGVALVSAAAGFLAVYVTFGRADKPVPQSASLLPVAAAAGPRALATGEMTAFVFKKTPEAVPDIQFTDGAGKPLTLADFKGKTVLLNLWATWCAPCRKEMPALDRLQKDLGSARFEVLALSVDRSGIEGSRKFLDGIKVDGLKLYVDATARSATTLKAVGMPTTLLIDAEGREVGRLVGPAEWDSADAKRLIEASVK